MSTREWLVIGAGLIVIVWLNWYFLFADRGRNNNKSSNTQ